MNSNHTVRREPSSKEVTGVAKKDGGKSSKKAGTFLIFSVSVELILIIVDIFVNHLFHCDILFLLDNKDKGKSAKEEAREVQLREEACIREKVMVVKENLSSMLKALGEMAIANPVFTHSQLPSLVSVLYALRYPT